MAALDHAETNVKTRWPETLIHSTRQRCITNFSIQKFTAAHDDDVKVSKVKISLLQAMEAHRVARG
jgi:hypothetical protein